MKTDPSSIANPNIPADAVIETWESVLDKSLELARLIEAHCRKTGEQFDRLLIVPRGGLHPGNILSRELNFSGNDTIYACLGSYKGTERKRQDSFEYGQMPTDEEVRGKDLLIIDEVCESGNTLAKLSEILESQDAGLVRTAVLHYKPERSETGFKPDFFVSLTNKWVVYPWEELEARGANSVVHRSH
jgi:hypoxanthine phosphoribosyltransferase